MSITYKDLNGIAAKVFPNGIRIYLQRSMIDLFHKDEKYKILITNDSELHLFENFELIENISDLLKRKKAYFGHNEERTVYFVKLLESLSLEII